MISQFVVCETSEGITSPEDEGTRIWCYLSRNEPIITTKIGNDESQISEFQHLGGVIEYTCIYDVTYSSHFSPQNSIIAFHGSRA